MLTPTWAMLWELWQTSRYELLIRTAGQCLMVFFITCVGRNLDDFQKQAMSGVIVFMLMITGIFSQSWIQHFDSKPTGFSFQLGFLKPVSTGRLVLIPLSFIILTSLMSYGIPALLYRALTHTELPILVPAFIVGYVATSFAFVVWSMDTRLTKLLGLIVFAVILMIVISASQALSSSQDPLLFRIGRSDFFQMPVLAFVCPGLVWLFGLYATVYSVERQRHGDSWNRRRVRKSELETKTLQSLRSGTFRSPMVAQIWYELHRSMVKSMTIAIAIPILIVLFSIAGHWLYPGQLTQLEELQVWLVVLGASPLVFQLVATDFSAGLTHKQGTTSLSIFDATRAMTDDQLIACKLISIALVSLLCWCVVVVSACLHLTLGGNWMALQTIQTSLVNTAHRIPNYGWLVLIANWLFGFLASSSIGLTFVLWMPLHPRAFVAACIGFALHVGLVIWDVEKGDGLHGAWRVYAVVISTVVAAVSLCVVHRALDRGSLSRNRYRWALGFWTVYVATFGWSYYHVVLMFDGVWPVWSIFPIAGWLLVPLAAVASAPLTLGAHRHA